LNILLLFALYNYFVDMFFTYSLRKIGYSILVLWGVVTVVFLLFNVLPGDPARMMLGQRADQTSVDAIRHEMGFDKPLAVQYLRYINDLSPLSINNLNNSLSFFYASHLKYGSFHSIIRLRSGISLILKSPFLGRSYQSKKKVSEMIRETLPNTFLLALVSIVFASIIGLLLGIMAALRKGTALDKGFLFLSAIGMSLPSFFAAIIFGWLFAFVLGHFTGLNLTGNLYEIDDLGNGDHLVLKNLVLPAFTLGIRPLSIVMQLSRNTLLDVLNQDYIRTAKAKGLSFPHILRKHAIKNMLAPVITAISGWFASLMAGVVFVEYIFGWKGLGYVIVDALNDYDMPVVLGCILTISVIFILINVLVDVMYSVLDPRVKLDR
jgi:peptide/nickel transport system permease protein